MIAILSIKLLVFGVAFILQSCNTDSIEDFQSIEHEQKLAISNFESLVREATPEIQSIVTKHQNLLRSRSTDALKSEEEAKEAILPIVIGTKKIISYIRIY